MGAHWTCAVPPPATAERPAAVEPDSFDAALAAATEYLSAKTGVFPATELGLTVRRLVTQVVGALPGRPVQEMPLACIPMADGPWWIGADTVLGAHADEPGFLLMTRTVCRRLLHRGGRVVAAELVDAVSGRVTTVETGVVVVAADAFRTPQLLWTSRIRLPALGRYLNEHHQVVATVVPRAKASRPLRPYTRDIDERADLTAVLWVPYSAAHPHQGQVMVYEPATARPQVGLAWYAPQEPVASNAVWFDDKHCDPFGMPAPRVDFALSPSEVARGRSAERLVRELAARIGVDAPHGGVALLPPGSSLHYLGTVRMGARDDGESVCDASGRVWGLANLFVAGNGVIPGPTACNPTLTAVALAVLCGDELLRVLNSAGHRSATGKVESAVAD
jgi:choline dehydrogenase-like flavoprotein